MENFWTKKILILYFVVTLFFVKAGVSTTIQNYDGFNQRTYAEQIVNLNHNDPSLVAVGAITGEVVAGFTLAEVLITLLIIGIIASIVIPALIADTQEQELKTAWKKAFGEIGAAAKMQIGSEGVISVNTLKSYMNVVKNCAGDATLPQCVMNCPNGWGCGAKPTSSSIFITADGMQWGDFGGDKWCAVDVNGLKGPNIANKDVFIFCVLPDGRILPDGSSDCSMGYSPNGLKWLSQ